MATSSSAVQAIVAVKQGPSHRKRGRHHHGVEEGDDDVLLRSPPILTSETGQACAHFTISSLVLRLFLIKIFPLVVSGGHDRAAVAAFVIGREACGRSVGRSVPGEDRQLSWLHARGRSLGGAVVVVACPSLTARWPAPAARRRGRVVGRQTRYLCGLLPPLTAPSRRSSIGRQIGSLLGREAGKAASVGPPHKQPAAAWQARA